MNPFLRNPRAYKRTPVRAEKPQPQPAGDGTTAVLRLYDPIDSWGEFWGVSAKEFVAAIDELPDTTTQIEVLINSPGGEVWEGLAILNALRRHKAHVVAIVEGIAASSASFIASGVDELRIMENAEFFIHKAWGMCVGNGDDMSKMAADLEHEDRNIASIYTSKAGGTVEDWLAAMSAESWYSADEAVAAGLADSVISATAGAESPTQQAKNRFDLSALAQRRTTNSSAAEVEADKKESRMATLQEALVERLGIDADADEETTLAALDEALAEQATDTPPAAPDAEPTLDRAMATVKKGGFTVVETGAFADMQAQVARLESARNEQIKAGHQDYLSDAIRNGQLAPSQREHFATLLDADPEGTRTLIDSLPKNLIPVSEVGHSTEPNADITSVRDSDAYKGLEG